MGRTPLIIGNWKMNKTPAESVVLAQGISNRLDKYVKGCDVVVCPPSVDLRSVYTVLEFDKVDVDMGAQNVHWEPSGAYTGEISIPMLVDVGATWCIVGHSERRNMFGETDEDVNRKVRALVAADLHPIVCVGESLTMRDEGGAVDFVCDQVKADLAGLEPDEAAKCVVAYEPIWAIGTGRTALPDQAQEMCAAIRATLADLFGDECAQTVRILYGGSMKPENIDSFMPCPDIDGGLIGGASLKAEDFVALVTAAKAYAN
jgi:triosephosphate isomerase